MIDGMSAAPNEPIDAAGSGTEPRLLSARAAALRVLADLREGRRTARESIDALLDQQAIRPQDRALASEIVMGVVRHRLTIERVLLSVANLRWSRVGQQLQSILLIGAYQIVWLDGVPAFAAVSEAVNQAKAIGGRRAGQFTNAVLRQLLRQIEERRLPVDRADPRRSVRVDDGSSCQLRIEVFADPDHEPVPYLADTTSHPPWLVSRWIHSFGRSRTEGLCRSGMQRPPLVLRPNRLRTDAAQLLEVLRSQGVEASAMPGSEMVVVRGPVQLPRLEFQQGLCQPQDRTSMEVIRFGCGEALQAGQTVVDLCAGLGTKTTQVAEIMRGEGAVLATDKDQPKLERAVRNAARLGHAIIEAVPLEAIGARVARLPALHWILLDVPCSNTGVLARRPEARYRINERRLSELVAIQLELLDVAARLAREETHLLYSTCSVEPEENEGVSEKFGRTHPGWHMVGSRRTFPAATSDPLAWHDGGYWARWARGGP